MITPTAPRLASASSLGAAALYSLHRAVLAPPALAPAAHALLVDGLVAEEDRDAALEVLVGLLEARVAVLAGLDGVAGEGQGCGHACAAARTEHRIVITHLQAALADRDRTVDHLRARAGQLEGLPPAGALALAFLGREARLEPRLAHPELDVVRGRCDAVGARRAALEVRVRERHDVLVPLLPDRADRRELARDVGIGARVLGVVVVDVDRALDDGPLLAVGLRVLRECHRGHGAGGAQEHGEGGAHGEHRWAFLREADLPRREGVHSRFPGPSRARDRGHRAYTFRSPAPGPTTP
ncbi:MAG: hypothetical protein RLZZ217_692 [Planctomycetota bacterium]